MALLIKVLNRGDSPLIEPIIYLAIGFLVAMLLGLTLVPLVHNRAVRLTTRRMEAATPLSMAEIQADKDQLRAEFAMSARRLEMSVDQLKHKTTSQLAELGKKTDAINRLKLELGEKNATIFSLEAREKAVKEQLRATEEEFATKTESLRQAEKALHDKQSELGRLSTELNDRSVMAENRQVELATVNTQIDALKLRVGDAEKDFATTQARLEAERKQSDAATRDLNEARARVESLSQRVTDLDRQLIMQVKEAELLGNRVNDLETRLSTQGKLLAEREYEVNQLRQAREAAERTIKELRDELDLTSSGSWPALERLKSEKAAVEEQLRIARDERAKLQRDVTAIQAQAESSWATERMENALLRERINDIAAEVAKLAIQLEGPNSPIEALLAAEPEKSPSGAVNGTPPHEGGATEGGGTLAERIRALQTHASRARTQGA
jgi:chromosome segregation ATPase